MKHNILTIVFSALLAISCSEKKSNQPSEKLHSLSTIEIDIDKSKCLRFTEVFEKPEFVKLETNIYNLFSNPFQTVVTDSNIIIVSRDTRYQILIFDRFGRFMNSIYKVGRGPDEYFGFGYIKVHELEKTISIFELLSRTFITMDYKGNFIKKIPAKTFYTYNFLMDSAGNKIIVDLSSSAFVDKPKNTNLFHMIFYYPISGEVKSFLPMNREVNFLTENTIYSFMGSNYFMPPLVDTIYRINNDGLKPRYILDFKSHSKNKEVFSTLDPDKYNALKTKGTVWFHYDFKETEKYIYSMHSAIGNLWYFHLLNKKNGKSIVYNKVINDYFGQTVEKDLFFFDFPIALYQDMIVLLYQPAQVLKDYKLLKQSLSNEKFEKFKKENPEFIKLVENLKEDDNPILGFYKFKN